MARSHNPWLRLGMDAWMLGFEASTVVALRSAKIAAGGAAGEAEARRMVSEKVEAAQAWQLLAATGALGFTAPLAADRTLKHYRRKVRANRRRLSRG
ncbi:hypothetical protein [Phenylobacterium sp. J367]|uniref:hypothetical protein n=1 Tax=Phenylobacterium sp. J367 TaxID=2898435 RepID=UPI0021514694|nr:hypothetical protein [Phenylobacterium sp. J367]MCR5877733.1 hypothetical protein [Phenylobacterium sp. J367]